MYCNTAFFIYFFFFVSCILIFFCLLYLVDQSSAKNAISLEIYEVF